MVTVIEIPEWRGSGSPSAAGLVEGAARLAAMVPAERRIRIAVGETLAETAVHAREAIPANGFTCVIGGDCGVELGPVQAALERCGDRLTIVWFDAHADMNTPATSPSGAFHGMILRALQGEGPDGLVASPALRPDQVALVGARSIDPGEAEYIARTGIGGLSSVDPDAVLYVHIDLDVLDGIASVCYPEPGGLSVQELIESISVLAAAHRIVGLGVTEYLPTEKEDEQMLERLMPRLVQICADAAT
jgi:arginase